MDVASYFSEVFAGFEFLIALSSLIGIFGLVIGGFMLFFGGRPFKSKGLKIMLISIDLKECLFINLTERRVKEPERIEKE